METKLNIIKHENKTSKNGKDYTKFDTSQGWMSCFEKDLIDELKKYEGKGEVAVDVATSGDFKNIRKLLPEGAVTELVNETAKQTPGIPAITEARQAKDTSIYTSYCKDVFIAMYDKEYKATPPKVIMQTAIELVQQAREAFK